MSARLIDGKAAAAEMNQMSLERAQHLREKGIEPHLAVILVGDNPASQTYVRSKEKACERANIRSTAIRMPAETTQAELVDKVRELNADKSVHGILVQLPLPDHLSADEVIDAIDPDKDVDGFHPVNMGRLSIGLPSMVPCTPAGIMVLLKKYGIDPAGRHAVIVGRSRIVGRPMAMLLINAHATVTVCNTRTPNLEDFTRSADILIVATGHRDTVNGSMIKPGATVIDVGINRVDGRLYGDVSEDAFETAGAMTPVPGGVGPMTVAMLLSNTLDIAERKG
ncbi:MAG: bifunctional 5,10-methylene-tetrahydrofolate dehydrogenase/5,10-methylene-tetrahydrofolate cyclohydrolase [Clostridia bacterium]|nr:bifunctional 5,10-methylene-tetrahydrofolate dehydrogenase/5,10-methylene-tetrahydrofolate cyclohydrolase [Clostridia bacterium]